VTTGVAASAGVVVADGVAASTGVVEANAVEASAGVAATAVGTTPTGVDASLCAKAKPDPADKNASAIPNNKNLFILYSS
jgi:hypothetical protein